MRIPSYRKHHSSGQARVTLGGKDYLLGPFGSKKSKEMYGRLINEYIAADCSANFDRVTDDISIMEIVSAYKKHAKVWYKSSPKTYDFVMLSVRPLVELYASSNAVDFGPKQFKACRQYVMDGKLRGPKASKFETLPTRGYINDVMSRLKKVFKWAAEQELIPSSIHETLSKVEQLQFGRTTAPEGEGVEAVDIATVEATLPHLPEVIADMVRVQRDIGCRPGELCQLTPAMIDRSLEESKGVWLIDLVKHKTAHHGKKRFLVIGVDSQKILRPYLLRGENECLFRPCDSEKKRRAANHEARETALSCGNTPGSNKKRNPLRKPGKSYDTHSYAKAISRACETHGIKHWSPNQLRHAFAMETSSVEDIDVTAALMGHSKVSTTQIYAKRNITTAIEAVQRKNQTAVKKQNSAS